MLIYRQAGGKNGLLIGLPGWLRIHNWFKLSKFVPLLNVIPQSLAVRSDRFAEK